MRVPKTPPGLSKSIAEEVKADPAGEFFADHARAEVVELVERANCECWNYEDCGYRASQAGLTHRRFWIAVKLSRMSDRQPTPILDGRGRPFTYRLPPAAHRILHLIDSHLGGGISSSGPDLGSEQDRHRYLLTAYREEAISSSLIEGAATTRVAAKAMILSGRPPATKGERMVLNNYTTVTMLNKRCREPLTPDLLCEVQRTLTEDTLDDPTGYGRFRRPEENIVVEDVSTGEALHVPPAAESLPERVERLCAFANAAMDAGGDRQFTHPAVQAILLHFGLAYDHPFVDGNGRSARALFYWAMLRNGYWLSEFLTISTVINGQRVKYARAFLDTEVDDNDLTYFVLYHLRVVERSLREFREYLKRKVAEQAQVVALGAARLNPRQRTVLASALRDPTAIFTYESHARAHAITLPTARTDLLGLEELGLLGGNRVGRHFEFMPADDLLAELKRLSKR